MEQQALKQQLEALLLNETVNSSVDPKIVRKNRLGAYAYGRAEDELKAHYKADYIAAATRHQMVKTQLLPLVEAWCEVGINVLLLKGFYQAEFVYERAAERFYGDVDILIEPEDVVQAKTVAERLGWWVMWERAGSSLRHHVHVDLHLVSSDGQLEVEVHRFPVQSYSPHQTNQRRITGSVWSRAVNLSWKGASGKDIVVKGMHPVDALLVGLILNRSWSQWGVKPHDLLDMRALILRYSVTREDLEKRANELACSRTLELFLNLCNPWEQTLSLGTVPRLHHLLNNLRVRQENGDLAWRRFTRKLGLSAQLCVYVLRVLPAVWHVRRRLRRTQSLNHLLAQMDEPDTIPPLTSIPQEWLSLAVKWASKLVDPRSKGTCVLRSLVLYCAAKQRGETPVFYSGVRRERQGLTGHAWVELKGRPLGKFGDLRAHHLYKVNFRHPLQA